MRKGWVTDSQTEDLSGVIDSVKELSIVEVLTHYGVRFKGNRRRPLALCPFHMDKNTGSFVVNVSKNTCWCYACNQGGNVIKAVSKIIGKGYAETALQIACDEKIIDKDAYERLSKSEYVQLIDEKVASAAKMSFNNEEVEPEEIPEDTKSVRATVYEAFKKVCGLNENHRTMLLEKRHLSEERIKKDYFSMSTSVDKTMALLKKELDGKITDEELAKIPGFFEEQVFSGGESSWKVSFLPYEGIGIILRDTKGEAMAIQIRLDEKSSSSRYIFFSGKYNGSSMYRGGASIGTVIDYLPTKKNTTRIAITEGRFKSEALASEGYNTFSVQGVNNFTGMVSKIKKLKLDAINVSVFYDADMVKNPQVCAALTKLCNYLTGSLPNLTLSVVIWDYECGKGVDDLINSGNKMTARKISAGDFIEATKDTLVDAIAECGFDKNTPASAFSREERDLILSTFESIMRARLNLNDRSIEEDL